MMNENVKFLHLRTNVNEVFELLKTSDHHAYPVVDSEVIPLKNGTFSFGRLRGLMMRHDIITMLKNKLFVQNGKFGQYESYTLLRDKYPR